MKRIRNILMRFTGWLKPESLESLCVIFFLTCVIWWNIQKFLPLKYKIPRTVRNICYWAHLDQDWGMFIRPLPATTWFVAAGTLKDGTQVDLLKDGAPLSWEKPKMVWANIRNERWRKYLFRLIGNKGATLEYTNYACRSWNQNHQDQKRMESIDIVSLTKRTSDAQQDPRKIILHHPCDQPKNAKP